MPPPAGPDAAGTCHLWLAELDGDLQAWHRLLSADDLDHLARRSTELGRRTALLSRGLQRYAAACRLRVDPSAVDLGRRCAHCGSRSHGRPVVAGSGLDLSASHAGGLVAVAVVDSGRVGLDLEPRDTPLEAESLAASVLTPAEHGHYRRLPPAARDPWLLRAWVRKEAVLKCTGAGLTDDLAALDVRSADIDGIRLADVHVPGYVTAVATTGRVRRLVVTRVERPLRLAPGPTPPRGPAPAALDRRGPATPSRRGPSRGS